VVGAIGEDSTMRRRRFEVRKFAARGFGVALALVLAGCVPAYQYETRLEPVALAPGAKREVTVIGAGDWRDTGVRVQRGETYKITAEGKWKASPFCNPTDASGFGEETPLCFRSPLALGPVPHANFQTLIGRIGPDGNPFIVGNTLQLDPQSEGNLALRMNDMADFLGDNSGQMTVAIERHGRPSAVALASPPPSAPPAALAPRERRAVELPRPSVREPVKAPFAFEELAGVDFGRYYALVIGINNYRNLPKLTTAVADAKAISGALAKDYGFEVNILVDATRAEIIDALDSYRERLRERDNLLIYYAGHGWLDEDANRGYWLPVDADKNRRTNWVENTTVTDTLKTLRAKHVMIVADSCYSGTLVRGAGVALRTADYWRRMTDKRARVALTSGGLEPVADIGGGGHSPFAKALIDALAGNDAIIDGNQLFSAIRRPVMLSANQTPEFTDVRNAGHDGGDFLFVRKR
jgi:hypothetical protein